MAKFLEWLLIMAIFGSVYAILVFILFAFLYWICGVDHEAAATVSATLFLPVLWIASYVK